MTERLCIDYAWGKPDPRRIKAAGYEGVIRYLSHDPSKDLTASERDALRAQGLSIALVWETTATRAGEGYPAGKEDVIFAERQAKALLYPPACVLFYAVDFDATFEQIEPYFQGVRDASPAIRVRGGYAGLAVCEALMNSGLVQIGWQTVAWSHGQVSNIAHLYQRLRPTLPLGGDYDENVILRGDYGQWWAAPPPPPPVHQPGASVMVKIIRIDGSPKVYMVVGGARVWIPNRATFAAQGFKDSDIMQVAPDHVLAKLKEL